MRKALIDGDIFVYRAAWACNDEVEAEALKAFDSLVTDAILDSGGLDYTVYITGKGNFRFDYAITAEYKGNRKAITPPIHKDAIRKHAMEHWDAVMTEGEEADDIIAIEATRIGIMDCVMVSIDKDFYQIPGVHFNPVKKFKQVVDYWSGTFFFYQQILMGDAADNIKGIKGIGPAKSKAILTGAETELELYNRCVKQYGGEARVIENARLLWLRREHGQIWEPPTC